MAGATVPARRQRFKGDHHLFSSSDDAAMLTQLRATHAPDGRDIDVRPLLHIIEDIFYRAAPSDSVQVQHPLIDTNTQKQMNFF